MLKKCVKKKDSIPDSQGMCNKVVSKDPFMLKYCSIDVRSKKCMIKVGYNGPFWDTNDRTFAFF